MRPDPICHFTEKTLPSGGVHINVMTACGRIFSVLTCTLFLMACGSGSGSGSGISGTYADKAGGASIKFESGKVFLESSLGTTEHGYKVDGDKVIIKSPSGDMVLTRNKDGSLSIVATGENFKKAGS
jgi:hypothetical protein